MADLTGTTLRGYRIDSVLGQGGMAVVYQAYHPATNRNVALKVMLDSINQDATYVARFQQEAHLIARLEHAHILPVYDLGEAQGRLYIAMRLVTTGTLANQIRGVPMPFGQVRKLLPQIAGALDYAHSKGVIHRDLKPSNILIDDAGNSLLTDFGIAKQLGQTGGITRTGGILGTPAYMSPEQVLGQSIDGRSDVYALGVLLYQLVVGRVPFSSTTEMATAIAHVQQPPPPPRAINPAVPEQVERVILRALAKTADDRWATAGQFAEALELAFQGGDPVGAANVETMVDPLPPTAYPVGGTPAPAPTPARTGDAPGGGLAPWMSFAIGGGGVLALFACLAAVVAGLVFSGVFGGSGGTAVPPSETAAVAVGVGGATDTPAAAAGPTDTPSPSDTPVVITATAVPDTATPVVSTTPEEYVAPACAGAPQGRLQPGGYAYVLLDPPLPNRLRTNPGERYDVVGQAQPGEQLEVLSEAVCDGNINWWRVRVVSSGLEGWTGEGTGSSYWLGPCDSLARCP